MKFFKKILKDKFPKESSAGRLLRFFYHHLKPFKPSHLCWAAAQNYAQLRRKVVTSGQLENIRRELTTCEHKPDGRVFITATFGARYIGNRDPLLNNFLRSFLKMTRYPQRIEIIIKVDEDDDLAHFLKLKKKYGSRMNLRFRVSPRGRGYRDMHIWHTESFQLRSPSSRALFILSEDAEFIYPGWDEKLFSMLNQFSHDFYIGTPCSLQETIAILGPNPVEPEPVYWVRGDDYPLIGADIFKAAQKAAEKHPGWTPLGNLFNVDGFPGDLLRRLWERHGVTLHIEIPSFVKRRGVFCWTSNEQRRNTRTETLLAFFKQENQSVRDEMADSICREAQGCCV